jgi:S-layer protein (TIGR01564 family)
MDGIGVLDTQTAPKTDTRRVLVGGPSANTLVEGLAAENRTMPASEYEDGDALIQLIDHGPAENTHSIVVAGRTAEDTRRAARRLANADENPLPGQNRFTVGTGQ